mmetsp:Transcript_3842/g.10388  ORF Transcript_3842/g.10388 Transcript_3842/m.10388 type:complete len:301 (-) Transcript_3842:843-1745(-)
MGAEKKGSRSSQFAVERLSALLLPRLPTVCHVSAWPPPLLLPPSKLATEPPRERPQNDALRLCSCTFASEVAVVGPLPTEPLPVVGCSFSSRGRAPPKMLLALAGGGSATSSGLERGSRWRRGRCAGGCGCGCGCADGCGCCCCCWRSSSALCNRTECGPSSSASFALAPGRSGSTPPPPEDDSGCAWDACSPVLPPALLLVDAVAAWGVAAVVVVRLLECSALRAAMRASACAAMRSAYSFFTAAASCRAACCAACCGSGTSRGTSVTAAVAAAASALAAAAAASAAVSAASAAAARSS